MNKRITEIQESIAAALNALPDVFSTVQWGGRAYKLPGPNGSRRKPKLLAHTWLDEENNAAGVSFKLEKKRAKQVVREFDWIKPHSFRTLAPSGWITAEVTTKAQARVIVQLLKECRAGYPLVNGQTARSGKPRSEVDVVVKRMESILPQKKATTGWSPSDD